MAYRGSICAVLLTAVLTAAPAAAQVADLGKYPNLKGQWLRPPGSPNNWLQLAGPPPLTPEYQKLWEEIKADLKAGGPGNWPSTFCIPAGMPAMMSFYDPGEIIVAPETTYVLISHNDDSYRRIYTDGRDWPAEAASTFAGYSIGKWIDEDGDGKYDVLEVETRFLKLPRSYDIAGVPFHSDGQAVIKERIYLDKADPNTLYDEIMVIDWRGEGDSCRFCHRNQPIGGLAAGFDQLADVGAGCRQCVRLCAQGFRRHYGRRDRFAFA